MMKLAYRAYDAAGKQVASTIDAPNPVAAKETLRRRGLFVTEMGEGARWHPTAEHKDGFFGRRRRLKNLTMFTRHLQVLISAGTPMVEALHALERQIQDDAWKQAISDVRLKVEEGKSLSEALQTRSDYFSPVYRSLVAAGESGGNLKAMLRRLSDLERKRLHVHNSIVSAMVYPALLLFVATGVLVLLMVFVVPRFGDLFKTIGVPLPTSTKFLLDTSAFFSSYWWAILAGIVALVMGLRFWMRTPHGRRTMDGIVLRLPRIGSMTRSFVTARVARTLGMLLEARVSVLEAMQHTRNAAGNQRYADLIATAEDAVVAGEPMSSAFADSDLISPCVYESIRSGEKSAQVGPMLLDIADFMDEDNEITLRSLTSLIEPMILLVLGLLVGLVALSLFTPLFDITAMT